MGAINQQTYGGHQIFKVGVGYARVMKQPLLIDGLEHFSMYWE